MTRPLPLAFLSLALAAWSAVPPPAQAEMSNAAVNGLITMAEIGPYPRCLFQVLGRPEVNRYYLRSVPLAEDRGAAAFPLEFPLYWLKGFPVSTDFGPWSVAAFPIFRGDLQAIAQEALQGALNLDLAYLAFQDGDPPQFILLEPRPRRIPVDKTRFGVLAGTDPAALAGQDPYSPTQPKSLLAVFCVFTALQEFLAAPDVKNDFLKTLGENMPRQLDLSPRPEGPLPAPETHPLQAFFGTRDFPFVRTNTFLLTDCFFRFKLHPFNREPMIQVVEKWPLRPDGPTRFSERSGEGWWPTTPLVAPNGAMHYVTLVPENLIRITHREVTRFTDQEIVNENNAGYACFTPISVTFGEKFAEEVSSGASQLFVWRMSAPLPVKKEITFVELQTMVKGLLQFTDANASQVLSTVFNSFSLPIAMRLPSNAGEGGLTGNPRPLEEW